MDSTAVASLCRTYMAYFELGGQVLSRPGYVGVREDAAPVVYDVNHLQLGPEARSDAAFRMLEEIFGDRAYRRVMTDPLSAPACVAALAQADFEPDATLQGLLTGALRGPAPEPWEIRPVDSERDWQRLDRLVRADHVEVDQRTGKDVYSEALTEEMQRVRRRVAPEVQFFLAWAEGEAVGFFSSWPGKGGVGMVEDLFTLPEHRGQGIARALIHCCVADARARGARSVLIGSEPDDTPKRLYAAMGFEPTCLTTAWTMRTVEPVAAEERSAPPGRQGWRSPLDRH